MRGGVGAKLVCLWACNSKTQYGFSLARLANGGICCETISERVDEGYTEGAVRGT